MSVEPEAVEHRDRPEDGEDPFAVGGIEERAADLEVIALGLHAVDVGEVADVAGHLGVQVGLEIFGAALLDQRVGMVLVRDEELEAIDDVADARRLLGRSIGDHGLVGRWDLPGEHHGVARRADLDR